MAANPSKKDIKALSDSELLDLAFSSCDELRLYIQKEKELSRESVAVHKSLIREASRRSIYFFGKAVLGFDKFTHQTHKRWADDLQRAWTQTQSLGRLKPRGTFKTTLYGETFLLWLWAVVSPKIRIAYMSANQDLLDEVSAHLDRFIGFETESLYAFVFGIKRDKKAQKNTNDTFNITGKGDDKGNSLMFRTAGGATNGLHPHFIIVDDPMDKKDRESEAVRKQKRTWWDSLHPLLVPFDAEYNGQKIQIRHIMLICTRWHLDDLVNYIMNKDSGFQFEVESVYSEGYDADGRRNLTYPELITHDYIADLSRRLSEVFLSCQYFNDPLPEGSQLFPAKKLKFLRPDQVDAKQGSNYIFLDPAKGVEKGAYPALIVVNRCNGRNTFIDAIDDKLGLDQIIALGAKLAKNYVCKLWIYESNGTTLMKSGIMRALRDVEYSCGVKDIHETRNKEERIASMQPDLLHGENYFLADYEER